MEQDEHVLRDSNEPLNKTPQDQVSKKVLGHYHNGKSKEEHGIWNAVKVISSRNWGSSNHAHGEALFSSEFYSSKHFVQRMELARKMDCHNGCVNALNFNYSGTKLVSGSDDLKIIIWDWAKGEPILSYDSGHRGNVFQAKFLPFSNDQVVVSCARDGHIRLGDISPCGKRCPTRRLGSHRGPAHKLTILPNDANVFLTAGEDAIVYEIDVRQSKPNKLLTVKNSERRVALYSISSNPVNMHQFCTGGRDQYVRIFDRRFIESEADDPFKKFCPSHLINSSVRAHVTCAVYNYNGQELLASYNDEDIYSFSLESLEEGLTLHKYHGHRNNATIKGVNYYGPKSEFVVSGSDCGNIFFWDTATEEIVQCVPGDENGVVNCLEPHPTIPVLATSGLDDDVKIWLPSGTGEPNTTEWERTVRTNQTEREEERRREPDTVDGEMLWVLWRHIRRTERRRRQNQQSRDNDSGSPEDGSTSEDSDESDDEGSSRGIQCAPS